MADPTTAYAQAVVDGDILTGRLVRLACERHLNDLEAGHERGLVFNEGLAQHAIDFFPRFLTFFEGERAGEPFVLEPMQEFVVGSLFGWIGPDGYRRFMQAYLEIGKGNGKTPMAAGIGLYGLVADDEPGAQIYAAAVTRDQAGILFNHAHTMAENSPELVRRLTVFEHSIAAPDSHSYFKPVSSEARSLDAKLVHMGLIDEVHEHATPMVVNKMKAGVKGRRQPLILEITNSGYDKTSVCWEHHEYSEKVLEGVIENDSWFAYVCQLDKGDDWRDPAVWIKTNPLLGVSVSEKYLKGQVRDAEDIPSQQNIVKRLNFCIWTEQSVRWLDVEQWRECERVFDLEEMRGRECYAGLDMASIRDLTALLLLFPPKEKGEKFKYWSRFWIPADNIEKRVRQSKVPYDVWVNQGHIKTTLGNVIDYDYIRADIAGCHNEGDGDDIEGIGEVVVIVKMGVDRLFARQGLQIILDLQEDGFDVMPFGMGWGSMAAPMREFEKMVTGGEIEHDGNPAMTWNVSNAVVKMDPAGNMKPDKSKAEEKIDGVVAGVIALGVYMGRETEDTYDDNLREVVTV